MAQFPTGADVACRHHAAKVHLRVGRFLANDKLPCHQYPPIASAL
jgi:hypothetical protein